MSSPLQFTIPTELVPEFEAGRVIVLQRGFPVLTGPLHLVVAALAEREQLINGIPPTETLQ